MRKYRQLSFLLIMLLLCSFVPSSCMALEASPLIDTLSDLYTGNDQLYTIKDNGGAVITDEFLALTAPLYTTSQYDLIEEYVNNNVSEIEYRYLTDESQLYSGDIVKSQTSRFIVLSSPIEEVYYKGTQVRVSYDLTGSIYYDPNTAKISLASTPTLSNFTYELLNAYDSDGNFRRHSNNHYSTIASNRYSADFTSNFCVRFDAGMGISYLYVEYAPISNTLTITP